MEKQYEQLKFANEVYEKYGRVTLGKYSSHTYLTDPRRMVFMLARYKFVSKMLEGKGHVLEIGCADCWGTNIVAQTVNKVTATDIDKRLIEEIKDLYLSENVSAKHFDFSEMHYPYKLDGIFLLDVLEHIDKKEEDKFLNNLVLSLDETGICIIGMPSLESQIYASKSSKEGHINCKSGDEFKEWLTNYFSNVLMFSMNDEVVHTGFNKMAHYLMAVCISPKARQL